MIAEGKELFLDSVDCGNNFFYVLNDAQIVPTEYKVLHNQKDSTFVKCMNFKYNGKDSVFYFLNDLKSLSNFFIDCDEVSAITVISNLLLKIQNILSNGFLSSLHIDYSLNKIYVHPTSLDVSIVYLPINKNICEDDIKFKDLLRKEIFSGINHFQTSRMAQLKLYLQNNNIDFEDLYQKINELNATGITRNIIDYANNSVTRSSQLHLVSIHPEQDIDIYINKDVYKLGRNPKIVDYAITFNSAIGRLHCKIEKNNDKYYVYDLNSANGTYVNNQRIVGQPCVLKDNDILRLANLDLRVVIK